MTRARRSSLDLPRTIENLKRGRDGAISVCAAVRPFSEDYNKAQAVTSAIDDLAEALTGDRELFWLKGHG